MRAYRARVRARGLDLSTYDRDDLAWAARAWTCHFTFLYDLSVYDPVSGEYRVDKFLEDGLREFGGYDILILWQGYPRLGVDSRNQFDMYRDMPGGLDGLRSLARKCHERGVKVCIDYNPWDTGTRREGRSDEEALADLVAALEADGIFLDTLSGGSMRLRRLVDAARAGVVLAPEIHPDIGQLGLCNASWAQWLRDPDPPGILRLKWIEPRHMQYQIRRWDRSHTSEIEAAFSNGSGMLVWENIFGSYNPWPAADRALWRRASGILRLFAAHFTSVEWSPRYPTLQSGLFASRWPRGGITVFTLLNRGGPIRDAPILQVPAGKDGGKKIIGRDVWNGRPLETVRAANGDGKNVVLKGSIERLGCLVVIDPRRAGTEATRRVLAAVRSLDRRKADDGGTDPRSLARSVVDPKPVAATTLVSPQAPPPGMVLVPGASFRMRIEHMRRECGCVPDPGTPKERYSEYLRGTPHDGRIRHNMGPFAVKPFFIDEAEVSNEEFRRFLEATGYRPRHARNFLKHWPRGTMPPGLAKHPVVYVDLDDARAYARWAGKRLPTEVEWQLAAQGTDGRPWPWGNAFDASRCNTTGTHTLAVRSLPAGRSPYGCYHLSGNVWEWTESERSDGHTRFVFIRGGSYFDAGTSIWYVRGGPKPCNHHAKFLLMWPGLDRCATIGFRCAVDCKHRGSP